MSFTIPQRTLKESIYILGGLEGLYPWEILSEQKSNINQSMHEYIYLKKITMKLKCMLL